MLKTFSYKNRFRQGFNLHDAKNLWKTYVKKIYRCFSVNNSVEMVENRYFYARFYIL